MKTAMQELVKVLDDYLKLEFSPLTLQAIKIIKEIAEDKLITERRQIENAYNNAKDYSTDNCDGSKYYFMNYITND